MATEKRLIDANALLRRICAERDEVEIKTGCDIGYHNGLSMGASMTISATTVDAAPVVHAHWEEWWPGECALIMTRGNAPSMLCLHCKIR